MSIIDFVNCHNEKVLENNKYVEDKSFDVKEVNTKEIYVYDGSNNTLYEMPTTQPEAGDNVLTKNSGVDKLVWKKLGVVSPQCCQVYQNNVASYNVPADVPYNQNYYFNLTVEGFNNYISGVSLSPDERRIVLNEVGVYSINFSCAYEEVGVVGITYQTLLFGINEITNEISTNLQETWIRNLTGDTSKKANVVLGAFVIKLLPSQNTSIAPYVKSYASPNFFRITNFNFTVNRIVS